MKQLIGTDIAGAYSFDKSAKTVTILNFPFILTNQNLLLINNATAKILIYSVTDTGKTAAISNNVISLSYDTSSMSNSDILEIWVSVDTSKESVYNLMERILQIAASNGTVTTAGMQQMISDGNAPSYPVTNIVGFGPSINRNDLVESPYFPNGQLPSTPWYDDSTSPPNTNLFDYVYTYPTQEKWVLTPVQHVTASVGPVDERWAMIVDSQTEYGTNIRDKLSWS